jgi:hypothetical protein
MYRYCLKKLKYFLNLKVKKFSLKRIWPLDDESGVTAYDVLFCENEERGGSRS